MRKTREILRQVMDVGLGNREVASSVGVSMGAVSNVMQRARAAALDWAAVCRLSEDELEARVYGAAPKAVGKRAEPDPAWIHVEKMRPGVTLELLHLEYLESHPDGLRYTAFCDRYRAWLARQRRTMRQTHRAGERAYVDYSGKKPSIVDRRTGEKVEVELFVGVLGASSLTYAEATRTQRGVDFIQSHVRFLDFLGGVPALLTPDQLKSGVTTSCWYDPAIQRTYEEMAEHYGTAVLPARPRKPRDKAKVEVAVQVAQRWILARLRNETFFSLEDLNVRIAGLLDALNNRRMRAYGKSRRELFEAIDKPALKPLPSERFAYADWKKAKVNIDYHVDFDGHFYSVPHTLVGEHVDVRATAMTVEVFFKTQRMASHVRSSDRGRHTTTKEHMPRAHQEHLEWPPSRIIEWAGTIGPNTRALVEAILSERRHPEQGYRPSMGLIRLAKTYGKERVDRACERAHLAGARSYRHVAAILKNRLDEAPLPNVDEPGPRVDHENLRGPDYYN